MTISRSERVDIYKHVARVLKTSGEVAGEGFILRLAEITVDATIDALEAQCPACGKPAAVVGIERYRGGVLVHCDDCMVSVDA